MKQTIICLENITFAYPGNPPILAEVDLQIKAGEFVVILGPNGSAKTTLLKIMLGLLKPQKGSVYVSVQKGTPHAIGYLPQKTTAFNQGFPATVKEVLKLSSQRKISGSRKLNKDNYTDNQQQIQQALEKVNLWDKRNCLLGTLSGGQLQRVFIARTLMNYPEVIFLDEPANNLDVQSQEELYQLLSNLHQEGLTIVIVTHDVSSLLNYATRFLIVNKNKITEIPKEHLKVV
jgi:zinc transport system ATP-binding protein